MIEKNSKPMKYNVVRTKLGGLNIKGLYLVNCVRIDCSPENITVLGSPKVFYERILLRSFS